MDAILFRRALEKKQTLGIFQVFDEVEKIFECKTMELPWKENKINVSCIPPGSYWVVKHTSPKYDNCFWVLDVPGRTEILIHIGNYNMDTLGCILPGRQFSDINHDGLRDVTSSAKTMETLWNILPDKFKLKIIA